MMPLNYLAIEGPIGVGKTTLCRKLQASLHFKPVLEDIKNPWLGPFYAGQKEAALRAQMFFLHSRAQAQAEIRRRLEAGQRVVADFTFQKDLLFAEMNLPKDDLGLYRLYYDLFEPAAVRPDLIVYLQAGLKTLQQRIKRRAKAAEREDALLGPEERAVHRKEKGIRTAYLEAVAQAYEKFFIELRGHSILIVNTERLNVVDKEAEYNDLLEHIQAYKPGIQYYSPRNRS
jgi:deoxyadenosine/deoxycytidine kinase